MNGRPPFPLPAQPAPPGWLWRRRLRRLGWGLLISASVAGYVYPFARLYLETEPSVGVVSAPMARVEVDEPVLDFDERIEESSSDEQVAESPGVVVRRVVFRETAPAEGERLTAEAVVNGYSRRLEKDADWADGWAGLASALATEGRKEEAAAAWRRLKSIAPLDRRADAGLALLAPAEEAERRLTALLRDGREPWLLTALGGVRAAVGRRASALAAYREALKQTPDDERLRRRVALLEGGMGWME